MRILFYDYETTGLSREKNELLNIAAIVYDTDKKEIGDVYNQYIKPSIPIPFIITKLTGISNAMVSNSYSEGIVLYDFMNWIEKQHCEAHAGHNIKSFDDKWTETKCNKYKIINQLPTLTIDTLDVAKQAYKEGVLEGYNYTTDKGNLSFKLENLMNYFNLGIQEHKAITDVQFNIMVYQKLQDALNTIDYGF